MGCRSWIVVGLLLVCGMIGCAGREEKIADFLRSGDGYLQKNDPARAVIQYKNALQLDPRNVSAILALAKAYEAMEDYPRAFATYQKALEVDPYRDEAHLAMARLLAMARKGGEALAELEKLRDPSAREPSVSVVRARALIALNRAPEAIAVLKEAPGAHENKEATALLALVCERENRQDEFLQAVERWRRLDPMDPGSYFLAARHAARLNRKHDALRELSLMVEALGKEPEALLLQARALDELGYLKEAEAAYHALPDEPRYLREKVAFALRRSDPKEARRSLEKLAEALPEDADAVVRLAKVSAEMKDPQGALAVLDRHLPHMKTEADQETLRLTKAEILATLGRSQDAETICRRILRDNQASTAAHLLLTKLLFLKRDFENAELHANQAATALADDPEAQLLLAQVLRENGKTALAHDTLKKALERRPESAPLRFALLQSLIGLGRNEEALAIAQKALEISPDDPVWLRIRANLRAALKDRAGAEDDLRRLIQLRPDSPVGHLDLGRLYQTDGKLKEAEEAYRAAIRLAPRWPEPYRALAGLYVSQGRLDQAIRDAEKAYRENPTASLAMHLAGLYQVQGRYGEAAEIYEEILSRWGESPDILNNLAYLYSQEENTPPQDLDRARRLAEEALEARPDHPAYLDTLAVIAHRQGRLDDAWQIIERALRLAPDAGEHHLHAARIARDRGYPDVAAEHARRALETGLPPHLQAAARDLTRQSGSQKLARP